MPFALVSNLNTDTFVKILKKINIGMWLWTKAEAPLISFLINAFIVPKPTRGPLCTECNLFSKITFHIDFIYLLLFLPPLAKEPDFF